LLVAPPHLCDAFFRCARPNRPRLAHPLTSFMLAELVTKRRLEAEAAARDAAQHERAAATARRLLVGDEGRTVQEARDHMARAARARLQAESATALVARKVLDFGSRERAAVFSRLAGVSPHDVAFAAAKIAVKELAPVAASAPSLGRLERVARIRGSAEQLLAVARQIFDGGGVPQEEMEQLSRDALSVAEDDSSARAQERPGRKKQHLSRARVMMREALTSRESLDLDTAVQGLLPLARQVARGVVGARKARQSEAGRSLVQAEAARAFARTSRVPERVLNYGRVDSSVRVGVPGEASKAMESTHPRGGLGRANLVAEGHVEAVRRLHAELCAMRVELARGGRLEELLRVPASTTTGALLTAAERAMERRGADLEDEMGMASAYRELSLSTGGGGSMGGVVQGVDVSTSMARGDGRRSIVLRGGVVSSPSLVGIGGEKIPMITAPHDHNKGLTADHGGHRLPSPEGVSVQRKETPTTSFARGPRVTTGHVMRQEWFGATRARAEAGRKVLETTAALRRQVESRRVASEPFRAHPWKSRAAQGEPGGALLVQNRVKFLTRIAHEEREERFRSNLARLREEQGHWSRVDAGHETADLSRKAVFRAAREEDQAWRQARLMDALSASRADAGHEDQ
jgi:hypothetical protein